ncbi:MAG: hypothetical protein KGJ59_06760 [Bacteroidota bacterium]|nr:hypothetical protein [Bacteroidota bacterium]
MKYIAFVFLALTLIFSQNSFSQTESPRGKVGLVFSFSGFNLSGGVGAKYWMSSATAVRLNFHGSYSKNSNNNYSTSSASVALGEENHFKVTNGVSPYVGVSLGYTRRIYASSFSNEFDANGFVGVEFWVYKSVTLSGEQGFLATYSKYSTDSFYSLDVSTSTSSLLLSVYF